jgi:SnoaL-like domain
MDDATELEAIRRLKYAYFRTLDLKQFDGLGSLLTEDATAAYEDGRTVLSGREAIVTWLSAALSSPDIATEHHGHHPEIDLTSATTATGTWYLQDRVIVPSADLEIGGTAFYTDRYVKTEEGWRIAHTGYMRVFEEHRTHSTLALTSFTSRFAAKS